MSRAQEKSVRILEKYKDIIAEEVNVEDVHLLDASLAPSKVYVPIGKQLSSAFGKDTGAIIAAAKAGHVEELPAGHIRVLGKGTSWDLTPEMFDVRYEGLDESSQAAMDNIIVDIDFTLTPELRAKGVARDMSRTLNQMRKDAACSVDARITVQYTDDTGVLTDIIQTHYDFLAQEALLDTLDRVLVAPAPDTVATQQRYVTDSGDMCMFYLLLA